MSDAELAYRRYWERKRLRAVAPRFPVVRWWSTESLCELERMYLSEVRGANALLDVGAGDHRVRRKLERAGLRARYDTVDPGHEFAHTFRDLSEVTGLYEAILCLDVIEHLPLAKGLGLLDQLVDRLAPGGVLIVQTPNGRCVRSALGTDMTHLQLYNLPDLWSYLTAAGLEASGFRVAMRAETEGVLARAQRAASSAVTVLLGLDYTDNIAVIARRPKA